MKTLNNAFNNETILIFLDQVGDSENTAFNNFLDYIGNISNNGEALGQGNLPSFSVRSIMPFDLSRFYRYNGSLTIPNCYETVIWNVFDSAIEISQAQVRLSFHWLYYSRALA